MTTDRDDEELPTGETLRLLAHEKRYRLLLELCENPPEEGSQIELEQTLESLSESMEEIEAVGSGKDGELDRLAIEFRHNHLPQLTEWGVIDWDEEENAISRGPAFEKVRPVLELLEDHRDELPGTW